MHLALLPKSKYKCLQIKDKFSFKWKYNPIKLDHKLTIFGLIYFIFVLFCMQNEKSLSCTLAPALM